MTHTPKMTIRALRSRTRKMSQSMAAATSGPTMYTQARIAAMMRMIMTHDMEVR